MEEIPSFDLLDARQRAMVEARVAESSKSVLAAYLLWWFLGVPFFLHRFYLHRRGAPCAAAAILALIVLAAGSGGVALIGGLACLAILLLWVLDAFRMTGWIDDDIVGHRNRLADQMLGGAGSPELERLLEARRQRQAQPAGPVEPQAIPAPGPLFRDD